MKVSCEVVKDLLPLYCDNVCSGESKALVEEHLEECEACREEYQKLREDEAAQAQAGEEQKKAEALKKVKKRLRVKRIVAAVLSVVLFATVCTGAGMWMNVATIDVDGEGLIERVEYDPTPPEWINEPDVTYEREFTQEELDHWGGRLKIYFSKDRREADTFGLTCSLSPVKMDGKTKTVMICSIRRTVWDYLTRRPQETELPQGPMEMDVGGPAWPELFSEDGWYDENYHGERGGYYYVDRGFYTEEEMEAMRLDECVIDALYYLPYNAFTGFAKLPSEEAAKIIEEKGILLWEKEAK